MALLKKYPHTKYIFYIVLLLCFTKKTRDRSVWYKVLLLCRFRFVFCRRYYYVVFITHFFFPTKQISTVTITDRFSLTTHVVESFMPVPKHRATTMFSRTFKYPPLRGVYSAAAGTALPSPRHVSAPCMSVVVHVTNDNASYARILFIISHTLY